MGLRSSALPARFLRFAAVGTVSTAADFALFNLGIIGSADPGRVHLLLANSIAFALATLLAYRLNSEFTFSARRDRRSLLRYAAVALGGLAIYDTALLTMLHLFDARSLLAINAAKLVAVGFSGLWNFCGYAFFAFRSPARVSRHGEEVRV